MKFLGLLVLLILAGKNIACAEPSSPSIEYIGVAANTDKSSGGHSALLIGDQVYQYQAADDMLLFLQRDPWPFFERKYRQLDNRSLTLVKLDLSEENSHRIQSRLNRIFIVQKKHIARWEALKAEQLWFEALGNGEPEIPIPFLACFDSSSSNNENTRHLLSIAVETTGKGFIDDELNRVSTWLRNSALHTSRCEKDEVKIDAYPATPEIIAEHRLENLALREALIILKQGKGLSQSNLIAPDNAPLSEQDRLQLKQLALYFEQSLSILLASPRPDKGEALLLTIARYNAIRQSLLQNRLLLLNVFPTDERTFTLLEAKDVLRHKDLVTALSNQAGEVWKEERRLFMSNHEILTEYGYQRMENAAARYYEPLKAIQEKRALKSCTSGFLRPDRKGMTTPVGIKSMNAEKLTAAKQDAKSTYTKYLVNLRSTYGYSLLSHNCTTELAKAIQSTFHDKAEISDALGSVLDTKQGLNLIPSEFTRAVQSHWKTLGSRSLPSHRQEQVEKLLAQGPSPWISLRESNRWTTTTYPGSIHDDSFLFFADGDILWRPLQGTSNLLYGLANTGIGVVTAPTESGRHRVKQGLSGMFYSIPEMVGISIRKGRYDILPRSKSEKHSE